MELVMAILLKSINLVPEMVKSGKISNLQAVCISAEFVFTNYRIFGLQKFSEDFRSEIIAKFMENGEKFIQSSLYKDIDFFKALYRYVISLVTTTKRHLAIEGIRTSLTIDEAIINYEETASRPMFFTPVKNGMPKAPYAYTPSNPDSLKELLKTTLVSKKQKVIMSLAIRSYSDLSDSQIDDISRETGMNKASILKIIEYCKVSHQKQITKHKEMELRRDSAYYLYKRYKKQLDKYKDDNTLESKTLCDRIKRLMKLHYERWIRSNKLLKAGNRNSRPSSKFTADLIGICERQVRYYISRAKKKEHYITTEDNYEKNESEE